MIIESPPLKSHGMFVLVRCAPSLLPVLVPCSPVMSLVAGKRPCVLWFLVDSHHLNRFVESQISFTGCGTAARRVVFVVIGI